MSRIQKGDKSNLPSTTRRVLRTNLTYPLFVLVAAATLAVAEDPPASVPAPQTPATPIPAMLERPILKPGEAIRQLASYCDRGVAPVPPITSAQQWEAEAARLRREILDRIVFRGEAARWRDYKPAAEWLGEIPAGPGYRIKRLRFEALPGLWIPALLYEPEHVVGRVPAVLNLNGHTPLGKMYEPKQARCIHMARNGVLALNLEWVSMGQLHKPGYYHERMNQLDLCGTSGLAVFYLNMSRALDVLLDYEHTDPQRVGVTGLSGGGWQTIILSALDTRVKLSAPVAGYSSFHTRAKHFKDLGDSEQAPNDLAILCDYATLTAMVAPRPLVLVYNSKDNCCFESGYSLPLLLDAAIPAYLTLGRAHALRWHVNDEPGTHNYERENREAVYRMIGDFFFERPGDFAATEVPIKDEIKTAEQLHVELPERNEDFNTLALRLAKDLPRDADPPASPEDRAAWKAARREALRRIVRAEVLPVAAEELGHEEREGLTATFWRLSIGEWTVPAVELVAGEPEKTAIVVADAGRAKAAPEVERLLAAGYRVVAIDPMLLGESRPEEDFLFCRFGIHVASAGGRPLGFQVGQLASTAAWLRGRRAQEPVELVALGPRSSVAALIAAAIAPESIDAHQLYDAFASLKEVLQRNATVNEMPELFCFGLLEAFDLPQIAALTRNADKSNYSPAFEASSRP